MPNTKIPIPNILQPKPPCKNISLRVRLQKNHKEEGMGGRGGDNPSGMKRKPEKKKKGFEWVKEVSTRRLKGYYKRAEYVKRSGKGDPQGRRIETVGVHAAAELSKRGINPRDIEL
jgi:hypothetical protein